MHYVLTNAQMRAADEYTIEQKGIPSLTLMERAADCLLAVAKTMAPTGARAVCVCGGGNNGGDGFALARKLNACGIDAAAVFFATHTTAENDEERQRFLDSGGTILSDMPDYPVDLVADCLLGTGFRGALRNEYAEVISKMNACKRGGAKILSADIPSGVHGDNGRCDGMAVQADITVCLGEYKRGVFLNDGIDYVGKPLRADIGIALSDGEYVRLLDSDEAYAELPVRKRNSHKGTYKKAAIVAGSEAYSGAAWLSTAACLRSGAGYTTLYTPRMVWERAVWKLPEALLQCTNEGGRVAFTDETLENICRNDSVAYGMGLGVSADVARGAEYLLTRYAGRLILDADALNSLAAYGADLDKLFAEKRCEAAITPHVKEFSRLTGKTVEEIQNDPVGVAEEYARRWGIIVLLKNAASVITDGKETVICTAGNSGQAKGGSGDVLSGLAAGLCAWGKGTFSALKVAAYVAGTAADIAAAKTSEYALTATDCVQAIGEAFLRLTEYANQQRGGA